jgi:hypothetical protein
MTVSEIISMVFLPVITILIVTIGWFLKDKFKDFKDKIQDLIKTDERLESKMDCVDTKVGNIDGRVANIEGRMGIGYSTASSPVRLTPRGEAILTQSKMKEIVDNEDNKKKILDKILIGKKPTTAYDAQERTKNVIKTMANDSMFIPVKNYAFEKGVELDIILDIVSIYFRDFVLEKLGFKVEDLDKK